MLSFQEIKNTISANPFGKVSINTGDKTVPISGVRTLGLGEVWVIPVNTNEPLIQVQESYTLSIS